MSRLAIAAAAALVAGSASAEYSITILHTNDIHDRFEAVDASGNTCLPDADEAGACFGGTARLATAIAEARSHEGPVMLLDAGDWFQGTLFHTLYKGELAAEMMNRLGYDAMAVGNHEFDDGPAVLRNFAEALEFPLLMANADLSDAPLLGDVIERSTVIERDGRRIGLIGLTPQDTGDLTGTDIAFTDPVAAVQAEVDRLGDDGVRMIVLLSHSGYDVDRELARRTTGVDVIVGGHSHSLLGGSADAEGPYPTMEGDTAIVQAGAYGMYLGVLRATFDDAGGLIEAEGAPLLLDAEIVPDQDVAARVAEAGAPVRAMLEADVGAVDAGVDGESCRTGECEMGNLVADAMLDHAADRGADVAIVNAGGLRGSFDAGEVTMGDVMAVLPFGNTLATFEVDGATLVAALENGVSRFDEGAGRFPQVAGMTYVFDPDGEPGARIDAVTVDGAPIDPEASYGVVANDYVRSGADGYWMFAEAAGAETGGAELSDVVAEYLTARSPYAPFTDGRIDRAAP